jgi:predicted transcriptional regulator
MKKTLRRDRLKIYSDLLFVLYLNPVAEKIVLTQIQAKINVPFDRLKLYIAEIADLGLIENETSLKITEKGKKYLCEFEKILKFMNESGFAYR